MVNSAITTYNYPVHVARQIAESISETANTAYYVFMGQSNPANADSLSVNNDVSTVHVDAYRNMIQGKRLSQADANLMIRYIPYEANKVFDHYDHAVDLSDKDFYAVVNADAYSHVFKCLDNNNDANSTTEPNFAHISGANTNVYQTSDGYRWKYVYSVSSATRNKFATNDFFPYVANATVSSTAADGVLDIILVDGQGRGYDNYSTGTFSVAQLRIGGNSFIYGISNASMSAVNGFYTGCLFYISSGTGVGSFSRVSDYYCNSSGNFVTLLNEFQTPPVNGDAWELYPEVLVVGSGSETENVVARALVNAVNSNSIYRVEVLDRGAGYNYFAASVVANAVVDVPSAAIVRPIYAPPGGHGFDGAEELGAGRLCFSTTFSNSESNTLITTNKFSQIGLLKDPMFANVNLQLTNLVGAFTNGEYLCKINPVRVDSNASLSSTGSNLVCSSGDFSGQIAEGTYLYLSNPEDTEHQLVEVASVTNATHLVLESNGFFSCTQTLVYLANISSSGYVSSIYASANIAVTNVVGVFLTDDFVIGHHSGATANVSLIERNGVAKGFGNYIQLFKYHSAVVSGTYTQNEIVYQGNLSVANATLHSALVDSANVDLYTSNQVGSFVVGNGAIVGNSSGAAANIIDKYQPELVFGSGRVLYLEDIESVTRTDAQSETIKIIYEF